VANNPKNFTPVQQVLDLLENVRPGSNGSTALCPFHGDTNNSLSVAEGEDGRVLLKCFAGCEVPDIVGAIGLEMRDLFPKPPVVETRSANTKNAAMNKELVATYDYCDETGRLLYQNARYRPKDFRPRRPGSDGGWIYNLEGIRRVLYHLPEVITATHVIITEGEKDADRTSKAVRGFEKYKKPRAWAVTTCCGGASGWRTDYASYFSGKSVYILPDNDEPGQKFAQTVAQNVSAYARCVKIVALPDLPEKGDVSNYLDSHDAVDLQEQLRAAIFYEGKTPGTGGGDNSSFRLMPLRECFNAPEEQQSWLVERLLPTGGMSIMAAKPKTGKSTMARQLALSVARGQRFLTRKTLRGEVIYLALEEKQQEVTEHFRALGATGDEPIYIHCAPAPVEAMNQCRVLLQNRRARLLIIDPLFKFARVKDGNDYAQMTAALEPILAMARETDTHVLLVHHTGKNERADAPDAILGSTAILGNVDTAIVLARRDNYRTVLTRQRYGEDMPETVIDFDPDRRAVRLGPVREQADREKVEQEILEFLAGNPDSREAEILDAIPGRRQGKVSALRRLLEIRVKRSGKGGKSDPYKYSLVSSSAEPPERGGTRTKMKPQVAENERLFDVPKTAGTTGNKNRVPTPTNGFRGPQRSLGEMRERVQPPSSLEELAAILEVDGGFSRAEALREAKKGIR